MLHDATRPLLLALSSAQAINSFYMRELRAFITESAWTFCLASTGTTSSEKTQRSTPRRRVRAFRLTRRAVIVHHRLPRSFVSPPAGKYTAIRAAFENTTSRDAMRIATKVRHVYVLMYGACWCTHCFA